MIGALCFSIDAHMYQVHTEFFEGERSARVVAVESVVVLQPHQHPHRLMVVQHLILVEIRRTIGHGKRTNLGRVERCITDRVTRVASIWEHRGSVISLIDHLYAENHQF